MLYRILGAFTLWVVAERCRMKKVKEKVVRGYIFFI